MKAKSVRLFLALALLGSLSAAVLPVGTAAAATLCVNPGGTGGCFASIAAAVAAANPLGGDTIVVAAGTYNENNIQINKSLTIEGAGAGATIVDGGAGDRVFWVKPGNVVALSGMTVRNGSSLGAGGVNNVGTLTMTDCTITGNSAGGAGGVSNAGTLTMTNCTVNGNSASMYGGISNWNILTMTNCTVSGNTASFYGGIYTGGTLTMTNCTVSGNSATYYAGVASEGTVTMTNCTVSNNSAGDQVGGIYVEDGTFTLVNCTISGNTAQSNGGGIGNWATLTMTCTIVYGNTALAGPGDVVNSGALTKIESIVGDPDGDPDPLLGPLQHNGGPTETHALLEGSPAIDACVNNCTVATDQRGVHRPQREHCDIGAFELPPLRPPTVPALSLWGIGGMAVVLALFLTWSVRRRRARAGSPR